MLKLIFVLMLSAGTARAQMLIGAEAGPDAFTKSEEAKYNQWDEDIFAKAFVLENSTADLYTVFESTNPAKTAASYMRQGVYRQELLILYSIALDSKTTFKPLSKERDKGVTLQQIAKEHGADLMKIFRETEGLQKKIELRAATMDVSTTAYSAGTSSGTLNVSTSAISAVETSTAPPAAVQVSTPAANPVQNEKN